MDVPSPNDGDGALGMPPDLGHAVAMSLRERILDGTFAPGQRLVETELAEMFGTSRGPVRDGLGHLELSGLVATLPRRGSFVAKLTADDIAEIYSLRLALETLAINRAIDLSRQSDSEDLIELNHALNDLRHAEKAGDRLNVADADMALHRAIVARAGHLRLAAAWERLADQTLLLMTELADVAPEVQAAAGDHGDIVDHMVAGNAQEACAAMTSHLNTAQAAIAAELSKRGE